MAPGNLPANSNNDPTTKTQAFLGTTNLPREARIFRNRKARSYLCWREVLPPTDPPGTPLNKTPLPGSAHLVVQVQSLKVAIENETLHVAVQGEICLAAKSVHTHVMPVLIVQDTASAHRGMTRPGLDGAAA